METGTIRRRSGQLRLHPKRVVADKGYTSQDFRAYLHRLQDADDPEIRIHWPVIDIDGLEALDHSQRYGLQVADLSISGLRAAVEYDLYGNLEPRFAETLKGNVYAHKGNFLSYGAKAVPPCDAIAAHQQDGVKTANMSHWLRIFG